MPKSEKTQKAPRPREGLQKLAPGAAACYLSDVRACDGMWRTVESRTETKGTGKLFQAVGVALPPTVRQLKEVAHQPPKLGINPMLFAR